MLDNRDAKSHTLIMTTATKEPAMMTADTAGPLCDCGHPTDEHNEDGCMYPDSASTEMAFCPCCVRAIEAVL